ncbi:MAG: hypothetical protein HYT68_02315 [Candidatus Zambryskibacteria bacterium]|nr:hypothetical protein [Candidatus Zambryskibacteria bacterium]
MNNIDQPLNPLIKKIKEHTRFIHACSFISIVLFILVGVTVVSASFAMVMLALANAIAFFAKKWYPQLLKDLPSWWSDLITSPAIHIGIILSVLAVLLGSFWLFMRGYSIEVKLVKEKS